MSLPIHLSPATTYSPADRPARHLPPVPDSNPASTDPLYHAARRLESVFLAEMLTSAGLGQTGKAFGGGAGEEQFSSFLIQAQADEITKAGGIGLARILFHTMTERTDAP